MRNDDFVDLHVHTEGSQWDGYTTPKELVSETIKHGRDAVAITDHGNVSLHPYLQKEADAAGIKPIFGIEAYFCDDRLIRPGEDKELAKKLQKDYFHLTLISKTNQGLTNLWAASTESWADGAYPAHRPRMDWSTLQTHSEGLVALTGCLSGPVASAIKEDDEDLARERLSRLLSIFGDDLYLEIMPNAHIPEQIVVNKALVQMGQEFGVPLVATVDSHYPTKDHQHVHAAWMQCQTSGNGKSFDADNWTWIQSTDEIRKGLSHLEQSAIDESIASTRVIADQCDAQIKPKEVKLHYSKTREIKDDDKALFDMCMKGWAKTLYTGVPQEAYMARFEREFALFKRKGFTPYFLMVADYCLDPSTPVLTEDMRWVEVGKLEVGDKLAGFDENRVVKNKKGHRYWRSAEVVNTRRITLPTYKVRLSDGTETVASEDHQWLVASPSGSDIRWVRTKDLKMGQRPQRLTQEWDEPNTWEAGYIAGILDGEGYLNVSKLNNGGRSLAVGFSQNEGAVLDTSLRILDSWGISYTVRNHSSGNNVQNVFITGGRAEVMRLLGMARPQRLLAKLDINLLGRLISIDSPGVVDVEFLGQGEVVALETTTGTLVAQGFAHHNCQWARDNNILVGPGRGSAAASLVAYLIGITGLDPLKDELLFERFMTDGRQDYPDIDVDFPASKREEIQNYIRSKYGDDHVVRVGTHLRYKNKAVFAALFRIGKEDFANPEEAFQDSRAIAKIVDEAEADQAGLGLKWADLMEKAEEEFRPYKAKYPVIFEMAESMVSRLNSYGRHAAGMAISTEETITGTLPLRAGENGQSMITQFEMKDLEMLGLVKFDILTISTLDKVQIAFDMLRERGVHVDPYEWGEAELSDPKVWDFLNEGKTLGVFQVETHSGTKMTQRMQPKSIQDLSALVALVRPGPMNSGLTDMYLRRRDGKEKIAYPHPKMEKFTKDTQGALVYQEQVMQTCIDLAGFTPVEADKVRKVLGKKLKDEIAEWGKKFVQQAQDRGVDPSVTKPLWEQITEFAKYGFNKAHSAAYALLGFWTLYTKYKYGPEFFAAAMSTTDKERVPEFVREARAMGIDVLPQDVNVSDREFQVNGNEVRYGLGSIKGIGEGAVNKILAARAEKPFESFLDFQARSGANTAVTLLLARVGAFDNLPDAGNRKALVTRLELEKSGAAKTCIFKDLQAKGPNDLPCKFDWDSEPQPEPEINPKTGKKKRAKVLTPPKKCTVRCRNYTPPEPIDPSTIMDYTAREKRDIEMELLGIHLSSTVFDELDTEVREKYRVQADEFATGPNKVYTVAGTVSSVSARPDKNGKPFGRWKIQTEVSDIDLVAFGPTWSAMKGIIKNGSFVVVELDKRDRGAMAKDAMKIY